MRSSPASIRSCPTAPHLDRAMRLDELQGLCVALAMGPDAEISQKWLNLALGEERESPDPSAELVAAAGALPRGDRGCAERRHAHDPCARNAHRARRLPRLVRGLSRRRQHLRDRLVRCRGPGGAERADVSDRRPGGRATATASGPRTSRANGGTSCATPRKRFLPRSRGSSITGRSWARLPLRSGASSQRSAATIRVRAAAGRSSSSVTARPRKTGSHPVS